MTTAAQVKKLVRPLLERHSDLALVGRWIFVTPVHHFARGILVGRMLDAEAFRPRWAVLHLFEVRRSFSLDWGELLYNEPSPRPGSWKISDPDISAALIRQIEQRALPALRAIVTLDDYLSFVSQHYFRHQLFDWPDCRLIVEVALGDLAAARATCRDNLHLWSSDRPVIDDEAREKHRRLRGFCALVAADDRAGLAKTLHEWEAISVKNLKIAHLWGATPFPLEMQTAGGS
jgi:hypothetical protein